VKKFTLDLNDAGGKDAQTLVMNEITFMRELKMCDNIV
jgi:hypothetical protein